MTQDASPSEGESKLKTFAQTWAEELNAIAPDSDSASGREWGGSEDGIKRRVDDLAVPMAALCLSGGGIRSASFALGVLQALARFNLLKQFHYLSTVSGGGYIGGWLTAWRAEKGDTTVMDGLSKPFKARLNNKGKPKQIKEIDEIRGIRADSNYLTPRLGLLSADTWTVIALYVRNLVLNWCIYFPFFLGVMIFPFVCRAVVCWARVSDPSAPVALALLIIGGLFLCAALAGNVFSRHASGPKRLGRRGYLTSILAPTIVSTMLWTVMSALPITRQTIHLMKLSVGSGAALGLAIYALSWVTARGSLAQHAIRLGWRDFLAWAMAGSVVGAIGIWILQLPLDDGSRTVFGLSLMILALSFGELVYVGAESYLRRADQDREWLARSSGWLFATAIAWGVGSAISLYGSALLHAWLQSEHKWLQGATAGSAGLSGALTLILGWSKKTAATVSDLVSKWQLSLMQVVSIAAVIFALSLGILFAGAAEWVEEARPAKLATDPANVIAWDVGLMVALVSGSVIISLAINVNRFSLHSLYRNRLIRAFLGSARANAKPERDPDPFTGFDFDDNRNMADIAPSKMADMVPSRPARLFHVINTTLNLVSSRKPAWQERKATSFSITPLSCGNPDVGYRETAAYGDREGERGISLGTAMAISGAAVSPNQGYSSSPLVGLLLMFFNIRLGWWLGNPKNKATSLREGPTLGLIPALKELTGQTDDTGRWIYLSDGGHFDNLGIYEMVRRRCRLIVVSDAGCDPKFTFEDLGNAARKCYIDMGVSIRFEKLELKARQSPPIASARLAVGHIYYPDSDQTGVVIYVKPTFCATTEPPDVRSYASFHPEFPHESTADQWFTESQLEAYRALGAHTLELICTAGAGCAPSVSPPPLTLSEFVVRAHQLYDPRPAPAGGRFRRFLNWLAGPLVK